LEAQLTVLDPPHHHGSQEVLVGANQRGTRSGRSNHCIFSGKMENKKWKIKNRGSSILGTTPMEMESFQVCGYIGTKKSLEGFQDQKFLKFFGGSTSALGDYEVVYSVWWLWFHLGGVRVWQRRQRVRAAHK
jgi:hypothetical protein